MTRIAQTLSIASILLAAACGDSNPGAAELGCDDPPAIDADEATSLYIAAWTEDDRFERACMVQRSLAVGAILIDAEGPIEDRASIMQRLNSQASKRSLDTEVREAAGQIESRHAEARLSWVVRDASGEIIERGEDWLEFNGEGLLSHIHRFAGTGTDASLGDPLLAWQRAWNAHDEGSRADELSEAATENVRFTDLLTDVRGREALSAEMQRQQEALGGELHLGDRIEVFATVDGNPVLIRQSAEIKLPSGGAFRLTNYVRLNNNQIERLSGFPTP